MRYSRTSEEALTDKAVLLALLTRISHKNNTSLGDRLKLQKITFLFCYQLFIQRIKALNYTFFTYRWGPFTKDLYEAEADFEQAELIQRRGPSYSVTETGQAWGNSLYRAIESDPGNRGIVQAMDSVADGCAKEATGPLVELTQRDANRLAGERTAGRFALQPGSHRPAGRRRSRRPNRGRARLA